MGERLFLEEDENTSHLHPSVIIGERIKSIREDRRRRKRRQNDDRKECEEKRRPHRYDARFFFKHTHIYISIGVGVVFFFFLQCLSMKIFLVCFRDRGGDFIIA